MVKISNLNKSYGEQVLFNDLSLSINQGEKVGLIGRNGHGKSTIFQMISGNAEPDSGEITIPKNYRIGHLEQHLKFSQDTLLDECCLGLRAEDKYETWKAEIILSGLGFSEDDMKKNPSEFSGGYQIRLNLAKLLVSEPDMLMLDEPNNYLDILAIRWLEEFLQTWSGELILITHDRSFMDKVVTHTAAIHRTKARKIEGNTEKLYDLINQEEEIYEKTRQNEAKKRRKEEMFIERFKARASFASRTQSRVKMLEKQGQMKALENIEDLELYFNSAGFPGNQMMSIENISFSYNGEEPYLIENFTLHINKNERICIIGKNGY
jgi:ATP-binding cassette subfamily F protein 3